MKKTRKLVSLSLVLVMLISVFAGIKLYYSEDLGMVSAIADDDDDESGDEVIEARDYKILEIVPNVSMAQFGYLVGQGQEPVDMSISPLIEKYQAVFAQFGKVTKSQDGVYSYQSKKLFQKYYLPKVNESGNKIKWTIKVTTRTMKTVEQSDLDAANLVVISQTADDNLPSSKNGDFNTYKRASKFPESYDYSVTSFKDNKNVKWDKVFTVFKRIAGASGTKGTAPNFFIDYSLYSQATTSSVTFTPVYASSIESKSETADDSNNIVEAGSKQNAYKLYMMMTSMNPSTFYGLYFNLEESAAYGIDEEGYVHGRGTKKIDGQWRDFCIREEAWSPKILYPYFLYNMSDYTQKWDNNGKPYLELNNVESPSIGYSPVTSLDAGKAVMVDGGIVFNSASGVASGHSTYFASISKKDGTEDVFAGDTLLDKHYDIYTGSLNVLCIDLYNQTTINRTLTRNIINAYGIHKGILGGARVTNMSLSQFAGTNDDVLEEYDAIYLASGISEEGKTVIGAFSPDKSAVYKVGKSMGNSGALSFENGWNTSGLYSGYDITEKKKTVLNNFIKSGKPVIVGKKLQEAAKDDNKTIDGYKIGSDTVYCSFLKNMSGSNIITDGNENGSGLNYTNIVNLMTKDRLQLVMTKQPVTYYDFSKFEMVNQNGGGSSLDYKYSNSSAKDDVYINGHTDSRNLTFSFYVDSATNGNCRYRLYLDMNGDGRFSSDEGDFLLDTDGKYYYNNEGELFAEGTVATESGVVQTLVFKQKDPKKKNGEDNGVLPPNYVGPVTWKFEIEKGGKTSAVVGYSACKAGDNKAVINLLQIVSVDNKGKWGEAQTNNLDELQGAELLLPMKSEIAEALQGVNVASLSYDTVSGMQKIKKLFSGHLKTEVRENATSPIKEETIVWNDSERRSPIQLANAGEYYYMLSQQTDYDVNVLRLTTNQFEQQMKSTNPDKLKIDSDGMFWMKTGSEWEKTNLLVLGFGEYTSDIKEDKAWKALKSYLDAKNPAFFGRGAVRQYKVSQEKHENKLTTLLMDYLGFKKEYTYDGTLFNLGVQGAGEAMMAEYGTMCRYPLEIPTLMKAAATNPGYYQLDLSNDDVTVFFTQYSVNNGGLAGFKSYQNLENNYMLYKKGNITYCTLGMAHSNKDGGQKGSVFKLPEAGMLVNAIVGSQQAPKGDPAPAAADDVFADIKVEDHSGLNDRVVQEIVYDPEDTETDPTKKRFLVDSDDNPIMTKIHDYSVYTYIDGSKTKSNSTKPLGQSNGGDIVETNQALSTASSTQYTCKPIYFTIEPTHGGSSDKVSVFFQLGNSTSINESGKTLPLQIKEASGTFANATNGELETGKKYVVYVPLDSEFYQSYGIPGLVSSTGKSVASYIDLKIFANTDNAENNVFKPQLTTRSNLRIGVRGIFLID